jgi:hypothetical protein
MCEAAQVHQGEIIIKGGSGSGRLLGRSLLSSLVSYLGQRSCMQHMVGPVWKL